ncbi:MAG: DUF1294 domain-containing protein [Lachnospiraceae bacterium]|nr:DUF1294 domain-containing protein [Lachnospiraceae bacterium]
MSDKMMVELTYIIFYCIAICGVFDIVSLLLFAWDKKKAERHAWRIPEWVLLMSAVPGGIGALIGMSTCRHKTKKRYFRVWVGFFAILQLLAIILDIALFAALLIQLGGDALKGLRGICKEIANNYVPD